MWCVEGWIFKVVVMTKLEKQLKWYRENPFIKAWREVDTSSYQDTVEHLTEKWNLGDPVAYDKISSTVEEYLKLLGRQVESVLKEEKRSYIKRNPAFFMVKFDLNKTEAKYVRGIYYGLINV